MKKLKIFVVLLVALSCTPQEEVIRKNDADFELSNGRLIFRDALALSNTINTISNKTDEELVVWYKGLGSFRSLRSLQTQTSDSELPKSMLSVINEDGIYQIGNKIVMLKGKTEYVTDYSDENTIAKLKIGQIHELNKMERHHVKQQLIATSEGNGKTNTSARFDQNLDARYQYLWPYSVGSTDKHKYVFESYAFDFYANIILGVRIKTEVRILQWQLFFERHSDWRPHTGWRIRKQMRNLTFSANSSAYHTGNFSKTIPFLSVYNDRNLSAEVSLIGDCFGPFSISGDLSAELPATFSAGGTMLTYQIKYEVSPATWSNIFYCRNSPIPRPPGGGGGGGSSGGGSSGGDDQLMMY